MYTISSVPTNPSDQYDIKSALYIAKQLGQKLLAIES